MQKVTRHIVFPEHMRKYLYDNRNKMANVTTAQQIYFSIAFASVSPRRRVMWRHLPITLTHTHAV